MVQLFYGDGKGKTTASVGGAVRAVGAGCKVLFVQFYKDGSSSENKILQNLDGVCCLFPSESFDLFKAPDAEKINALKKSYADLLETVIERSDEFFMVVFDEGADAFSQNLINRERFISFVTDFSQKGEVVITGHFAPAEIAELADYVTEFKKQKHPFDNGIPMRKGVEL